MPDNWVFYSYYRPYFLPPTKVLFTTTKAEYITVKSVMSLVCFSEPFLLKDPPSHFFLPDNPEEPEFADWAETNVTAQLGGSVFLHCPVINSGDRAVSYPSVSILF